MKKWNICIVSVMVIFVSLVSCGNMEDLDISNEPSYLIMSNGDRVNLNVQYVRTDYFYGYENLFPIPNNITVVSSTNELEQYYENHRRRFEDGQGNQIPDHNFLKAIENYSNIFFNENILLMVGLLETGGSSIRHKVDRIDENGNIFIKSKSLTPGMAFTDIATWSIIIELNKNLSQQNFKISSIIYVEGK